MLRSTWTRVTSKKQIIRDYAGDEGRGKVSLLKILGISGALQRTYEEHEIILADVGYWWLHLLVGCKNVRRFVVQMLATCAL